ncbi:hypothetical protein ACSVC9_08720 [Clostridium sp. LBM24168]
MILLTRKTRDKLTGYTRGKIILLIMKKVIKQYNISVIVYTSCELYWKVEQAVKV